MIDRYGRSINNMRISVTQECNLDCFYCHHEGENGGSIGKEDGPMTPQEIERITQVASKVGITKLKITGGEPLLRKDIVEIVKRASRYMTDVSMTTNGVLLKMYASDLKEAGLHRVNVSFDAMDPATFQRITKKDAFHEVTEGVRKAISAGLSPVKLNMVILKGYNEMDIFKGIEFASEVGAILQLIEFETPKEEVEGDLFREHHFDLIPTEEHLDKKALEVRERNMHRRKKYIVPSENNGNAEVEVVRAMHNSQFCENCTRLRVTSSGELKPCLLSNGHHIDILGPIRRGAPDDELIDLFENAILKKEPYWSG
jgi:cyclic pyranopterin phosphate synthase